MCFKKLLCLLIASLFFSLQALAAPQQILEEYAKGSSGNFSASSSRGKDFYFKQFQKSSEIPSCSSCHTSDPKQEGKHAISGKTIKPLSPLVNAERFSDKAKVEKWFKRNCQEVVGRECNSGEKADFIAFLLNGSGK